MSDGTSIVRGVIVGHVGWVHRRSEGPQLPIVDAGGIPIWRLCAGCSMCDTQDRQG